MDSLTTQDSLNTPTATHGGVAGLFIRLVEETQKNLFPFFHVHWSYSWSGGSLEIRLNPVPRLSQPAKYWFALGVLLESMETRAAGAGLELTVQLLEREPGACVTPLAAVSRVNLLAQVFSGRARSPLKNKDALSPSFRKAIELAVGDPGVGFKLIEGLAEREGLKSLCGRYQGKRSLIRDRFRPEVAMGMLLSKGNTPQDYLRTGRALERLRLTAGFHGYFLDSFTRVDRFVRHPLSEGERSSQRRFFHRASDLSRWVPDLQRQFPLLVFRLVKGPVDPIKKVHLALPTSFTEDGGKGSPSPRQIETMVEFARWAPSGDNVQPFTFDWNGKVLLVQEEQARSRAFMNVGNATSTMALGMCLSNMALGAEREGWVAHWQLGEGDGVAARVTFESGPIRTTALVDAVTARAVDRRPYRSEPVPRRYVRELLDEVQNPWGIRFRLLNDKHRLSDMAHINGGFESFLFEHRASHTFFYRWLRRTDEEARRTMDGLPVSTLGVSAVEALGLRLLVWWGLARLFSIPGFTCMAAFRARKVYGQSGGFGVFTVPNHDPMTFVRLGWLWQRMWLKMAVDGWSLQPVVGNALMGLLCRAHGGEGLSPSQKARFTREEMEMRHLISADEGETIACVFRMGLPTRPVTARAPRRALSSILKIEAE
jgi:hypothetical protein